MRSSFMKVGLPYLAETFSGAGMAREISENTTRVGRRPSTVEDRQAIRSIMDGDVNAYGLLVERYKRQIFNLMCRVAPDAEAEELTQETFVRAYEKLDRFKPAKPFFPWLYTIGLNIARDFARKKRTRIEVAANRESLTEADRDIEHSASQQDRLQERLELKRLQGALRRLPIIYREALVLRFHEELATAEVAAALGIGVSAVKMRVKRGLAMLRNEMRDK